MDSSKKRERASSSESSKKKGKLIVEDENEPGIYDDLVEEPTDLLSPKEKSNPCLLCIQVVKENILL